VALDDIEPLVFAFVIMRIRPAARRTNIEKSYELLTGLFAVEQYNSCVAKRMQKTAFVGAHQERSGER
jgi:hypothetical protein